MNLFIHLVFVMVGLTMEVIWTAFVWFFKERKIKLVGSTSLWMIPIYAMSPYLFSFVIKYFSYMNIFLRGFLYMVLIFIIEYMVGMLFRKILKISPWDYSKDTKDHTGYYCKYNIKGLIALEFAPLWCIMGLVGEFIYLYLLSII